MGGGGQRGGDGHNLFAACTPGDRPTRPPSAFPAPDGGHTQGGEHGQTVDEGHTQGGEHGKTVDSGHTQGVNMTK